MSWLPLLLFALDFLFFMPFLCSSVSSSVEACWVPCLPFQMGELGIWHIFLNIFQSTGRFDAFDGLAFFTAFSF
jgi:hypothetical protein